MNELKISELFDLEHTIAADLFECKENPWEVLDELKEYILKLGTTLDKSEYLEEDKGVWVHRSAKVAISAFIGSPCIIGPEAEIRHCAYIRGSAIIGEGAVVGNSVELKNCILFDGAQTPHFNYIGDSILGYKAHLGAGAVTSNVKSDKTNVTIKKDGETIQTGRRKLGAMVGDNVEVGCNSVLCPGSILGRKAQIYPTSCVRGYVPANHIYKSADNIVKRV